MEQKTSPFDLKALLFNTIAVPLCSFPYIGWACFILLAGIYTVAVFRYPGTRAKFMTSLIAIAAAAFAYFSAYNLFKVSTGNMPDYFLSVAAVQFVVVLALAMYFHFKIYKPNKEFIKAGV